MHNESKKSIFVTPDGKNLVFTFILVSSLFLLWGFCNGMIDVMDKHFQEELHLSLSQSAWVQFAHYLGYFLMSLPAGILASKLGYKGGIILGLVIVGLGGFWFVPATHIAAFWAFLLGVCIIASGLTFLETVANPYTTVLGDQKYAATRINLAQSCNGIGWLFGPIAGGMFFYGKDASGTSTGNATLYIPYAAVAIVVVVLAVVFFLSNVPDIKVEDDYHLDDSQDGPVADRSYNRPLALFLIWLNIVVLSAAVGMIGTAVASIFTADGTRVVMTGAGLAGVLLVAGTIALIGSAGKITHHSVWAHPHFSSSTVTQFFYVAAQAGIFSFFVNYMTTQLPPIPASWNTGLLHGLLEPNKAGVLGISDKLGSYLASLGFVFFLSGRFTGAAILKKCAAHSVLGLYAVINAVVCLLIFCKLGWLSVICVFLSYFFMSIMFPTIFALGIHGLGVRAKKASSFIVMAIMGGAILPKLMGYIADKSDISRGFIVPAFCFVVVALYSFSWPKLAKVEGLRGVSTGGGH